MNVRSAIFLAIAVVASPVTRATDYVIDTVHTQVYACASHLGFATPCARFKVRSGFFHFDDSNWSTATVDATVDTASIDLGDSKWDSAVRSWEFLESNKYPYAHFVSRSAEMATDKSGIVHGVLTLRGVTRNVDLHVTFNRAGLDPYDFRYTAGFSATTTLKRSDFGMRKYLPDIGDEVTIRIEVEGLRGKPEPDHTAPAKPES